MSHVKTLSRPDQIDDGTCNLCLARPRDRPGAMTDIIESGVGTRKPGESLGDGVPDDDQGSFHPEPADRGVVGLEPAMCGAGVMATIFSPSPGTTKFFRPGEGGTIAERGGGKAHASTPR